jgi:hypothetical protein
MVAAAVTTAATVATVACAATTPTITTVATTATATTVAPTTTPPPPPPILGIGTRLMGNGIWYQNDGSRKDATDCQRQQTFLEKQVSVHRAFSW